MRLSINIVCCAVAYALFLTNMSYASYSPSNAFKQFYLQFKNGSTRSVLSMAVENDKQMNIINGLYLELSAGYRFNKNFAAELALLNNINIELNDIGHNTTSKHSSDHGIVANCYYSFTPDYKMSPYIKLGLGYGTYNFVQNEIQDIEAVGLLGVVGFGAKFNISEGFFVDIGYAYNSSMNYKVKILQGRKLTDEVASRLKFTSNFGSVAIRKESL